MLKFFNIKFNSNENIFLRLACGYKNGVAIFDKFDTIGLSIFSFKKRIFVNGVLALILV